MKGTFLHPLLSLVFLAAGGVSLQAEETAPPLESLTFEQLDNFRNERKFTEIIAALQPEDLTSKAGEFGKDVDQLYALRAFAYAALKEGGAAEADYKRAIAESPDDGRSSLHWFGLAENYRINLNDPKGALPAYQKTVELCFARKYTNGWLPIGATISAAAILCSESRYDEALTQLQPYEGVMEGVAQVLQIKLLKASAEAYLGKGQEGEANARLQKAQDLEEKPDSTP